MCIACDLQLKHLSDAELYALASEVDKALMTVIKVDSLRSRTIRTEEQLSDRTTAAWKRSADRAIVASLPKVTTTQRGVNAFLQSLGVRLEKPLSAAQQQWVRKQLDKIYKTAKRVSAKAANAKVSFSLVDAGAVKAIGEQQLFWIGDFYSTHLSARIQGVSEDIMLKQGLSRREAGKVLRDALRREFGIVAGGKTSFAPEIPARFAGNPDLYFRGVASTASHQSRTFGSLRAFSEADIKRYQITNPTDERTGQICQLMVGQVFAVSAGVKQMDAMIAADDPRQIKEEIAPWRQPKDIKNIIGKEKRGSVKAGEQLADKGMAFPPYHPLCRSEAVIIG